MNKEKLNLLLGLVAIGSIFTFIARNSTKKNKKQEEGLKGLPIGFRKVGEITSKQAKQINEKKLLTFKIKPGPIVVTEMFYQHIKKHVEEEMFHSFHEINKYVKDVIKNYNQIWTGSNNSILLVNDTISNSNHHIYQVVALQMHDTIDDKGKNCWNVHTAYIRKRKSSKNILLWKK